MTARRRICKPPDRVVVRIRANIEEHSQRRSGSDRRMNGLLLVALGGALGASSRYVVATAAVRAFGDRFPVGTLLINVVGCFLMGVVAELLAARFEPSESLRLFIATGFLGGFTTF